MPPACRHARLWRIIATWSLAIPDDLHIGGATWVPLSALEISYVRSPGPGGQNVNKVATAAQLRFDLQGSPVLSDAVKARAAVLAGSRLTTEGTIVIFASRFRSQQQNRDDAIDRLVEILKHALVPPRPRRATRPTLGSQRRRLDSKVKRGETKRLRSSKPPLI